MIMKCNNEGTGLAIRGHEQVPCSGKWLNTVSRLCREKRCLCVYVSCCVCPWDCWRLCILWSCTVGVRSVSKWSLMTGAAFPLGCRLNRKGISDSILYEVTIFLKFLRQTSFQRLLRTLSSDWSVAATGLLLLCVTQRCRWIGVRVCARVYIS